MRVSSLSVNSNKIGRVNPRPSFQRDGVDFSDCGGFSDRIILKNNQIFVGAMWKFDRYINYDIMLKSNPSELALTLSPRGHILTLQLSPGFAASGLKNETKF